MGNETQSVATDTHTHTTHKPTYLLGRLALCAAADVNDLIIILLHRAVMLQVNHIRA